MKSVAENTEAVTIQSRARLKGFEGFLQLA